jgi:hypothetical protein
MHAAQEPPRFLVHALSPSALCVQKPQEVEVVAICEWGLYHARGAGAAAPPGARSVALGAVRVGASGGGSGTGNEQLDALPTEL